MTAVTASEARAALPELLNRVDDGDEITITRHGRPVAILVRPDVLRIRRADAVLAEADRVRDLISAARASALPTEGLTPERAEQLIREIRAGREGR